MTTLHNLHEVHRMTQVTFAVKPTLHFADTHGGGGCEVTLVTAEWGPSEDGDEYVEVHARGFKTRDGKRDGRQKQPYAVWASGPDGYTPEWRAFETTVVEAARMIAAG